jgi:hypothetical protein
MMNKQDLIIITSMVGLAQRRREGEGGREGRKEGRGGREGR